MQKVLLAGSVVTALGWTAVRHMQLPMGPSRMHWGGTVFGHRGCRHVPGIPENTLDAYKYAVSRGCGGVECDVRLTRDGELVLFHDVLAAPQLRAVGPQCRVDELTLSELRACAYADDPTGQVRVPTLEELIVFGSDNQLRLLIEIKEQRRVSLCLDRVCELYERYAAYMYEHTTLIAFDPRVLYAARQRNAKIAVGQVYSSHAVRNALADAAAAAAAAPATTAAAAATTTSNGSGNNNKSGSGSDVVLSWPARLCPGVCDALLSFVQAKVSPWVTGCSMICPHYSAYSAAYRRRWHSRRIAVYLWGFTSSDACTAEMRQPGVCVSADDDYEAYATPRPPPNLDIFGDNERAAAAAAAAQRRQQQQQQKQVSATSPPPPPRLQQR